jgi:regulator of sigma D
MLESCKTAQERWGGVHDLIDRWLEGRQDLVVQFCSIKSLDELQDHPAPMVKKIQSLCEILVDYISAGHFEIYSQLISEAEAFDDQKGLTLYDKIYPYIEQNTQSILDFNDKYLNDEQFRANRELLESDLSALGEALASRFNWEDQLIAQLHGTHSHLA